MYSKREALRENAGGSNAEREVCGEESRTSFDVDRVVRQLNIVCKNATLEFARSVGKIIVDNCYRGDLDAWRGRGRKTTSFRQLAQHPDLAMSPTVLYRCVAIYELCERLAIGQSSHVSSSHIRAVIPLPAATQTRLLDDVERNRWSVEQLREAIRRLREAGLPPSARGGRKRAPRLKQTIRALATCVTATDRLVGADDPDVDLSPESARELLATVERVVEACKASSTLLEAAAKTTTTAVAAADSPGWGGQVLPRDNKRHRRENDQ